MNEEPRTIKTDEYTIKSGWLDVGHGHKVWYEQWGNPKAKISILIFHGGPGGEFKAKHKYNFDPKVHQLIGFDQRGCGNSLPYGKTDHNRTEDLINDALAILKELGVSKVHVNGASWGATLGLLFTIKHSSLVESLLIRGTWTATQSEIDWIDKGGFAHFYPEVWQRFVDSVPKQYSSEPAKYHYGILNGNEKTKWAASAKALQDLEVPAMATEWPGYNDIKSDNKAEYDYVPYKIYAWYLSHGCFLSKNYILNNVHKIKVPTYIVNGRYDMVCPPKIAHKLHELIKGSKLLITYDNHGGGPQMQLVYHTLLQTIY